MLYWGMLPKSGGIFVERMGYHGAAMGRPVHGLGQARGSAEHCAAAGGGFRLFRAAQCGVFWIHRLEHPGAALLPDGGDEGVPAGGGVSLPGQWAAAAGAQHPCPAGGAGVPPLWTEYGGDQRRGAAHLCALWTVGAAYGRAGAAGGAPGGDADLGSQPGQHAHPHGQPPEPLSLRQKRHGVWGAVPADAPLCSGGRGLPGGGLAAAPAQSRAGPGSCRGRWPAPGS